MSNGTITEKNRKKGLNAVLEALFLLVLVMYPMRHVTWGGDFWDVGYNYGNFRFGNMESMGKMWFFSTYLSNSVGHVLSMLPFGHTVVGLNIYTGLFASLLGIMGYLFCTRELKIPKVLTFAGEMIALSLCWCPTALLYNYITYVLFTLCCILLYLGLTKERKSLLILAGVCLGTNVFIRFSNLPEMGLILALWAYEFWQGWEKKSQSGWGKEVWRRLWRDTLLCLAGYLAAVALGMALIGIRYGLDSYTEGIRLLFAMTDSAQDYKPTSMLYGLLWPFKQSVYWLKKISVFAVAIILITFGMDYAPLCFGKNPRIFRRVGFLCSIGFTLVLVYWLYLQRVEPNPNFTGFFYTSYDPIYWPGVLFLVMIFVIGAIDFLRKGSDGKDRFWACTMVLLVVLTSLGSNNGIYPSLNHLFLGAPYVLWKVWKFTIWAYERSRRLPESFVDFRMNLFPVSMMLWAFLLVCMIQFGMFGMLFSFCEGTGQQEKGVQVTNNQVLRGISMSGQRAKVLQEISAYAADTGLSGKEVILHGAIPALSFYLELPPAFHSWNDLKSFRPDTMRETMDGLMEEMDAGKRERPVVIAEKESTLQAAEDEKWQLILEFMKKYDYEKVFENEKFVIWR